MLLFILIITPWSRQSSYFFYFWISCLRLRDDKWLVWGHIAINRVSPVFIGGIPTKVSCSCIPSSDPWFWLGGSPLNPKLSFKNQKSPKYYIPHWLHFLYLRIRNACICFILGEEACFYLFWRRGENQKKCVHKLPIYIHPFSMSSLPDGALQTVINYLYFLFSCGRWIDLFKIYVDSGIWNNGPL